MIKKLIFSIALFVTALNLGAQADTDVLMTIAGKPVTVEEFKYIYEKNNGDKANYSKNSINEYLDLYTKFKLKVAKAKDLQMDTIQSLNEELDGYKRQLANSYLMDKEVMSYLLKQIYGRLDKDVRVSHIYTVSNKRSSKEEDAQAFAKIKEAQAKLKSGVSFKTVANDYSMDKNTAKEGGQLGFFTAMMPDGFYAMENAMYETEVGKVSDIIKTSIGYHIIQVDEVRPARGKINVAHILIKKTNPNAESSIKKAYAELFSGSKFEDVIARYSEDSKTSNISGVLPEFGIGFYEKVFEDAAFGLAKDGDYSNPIQTQLGYHIIKRVSKPEKLDFNTFKKVYEPKIKKDERYEEARLNLISDIKKSGGYTKNEKIFMGFANSLDETFLSYKWNGTQDENAQKELFSFGGNKKYTLNNFIDFCKKNTRTRLKYDKTDTTPADVAGILYDEYVNEKAIDFEQSNLEIKYSDFRSLMREYEEGILLFEVTKDAVWDKANEDTLGLQAFYDKNKTKYMSDQRADLQMVFINTEDMKLATKIAKYIDKKGITKGLKKFNKKQEVVSSFTEKLDRSNNQFGGIEWKAGAKSQMEFDQKAKRYTYKKILETYEPTIKPLKEARGYIVADYQDHLEREWIKSLKSEYKVDINKEVLAALIK